MSENGTHLKIIFAGSVGAGKTASIQAVSDVPVVSTEEAASDEVRLQKEMTTVAMDYGQMNLEDGTTIHLYGAPGQSRFDFMWEILAEGALGVVLLVDDTAEDPLGELKMYFKAFADQLRDHKMVIGVTRTDLTPDYRLNIYRQFVARFDASIPLFTIDAREASQIKILIRTLLYRIDPWLS